MNLSGIVITADPSHVERVLEALSASPGLEVHGSDAATGRIVVVQEAGDVGAEVDGFSRLRALPHVLAADLVCHWFGDEGPADPPPGAGDHER